MTRMAGTSIGSGLRAWAWAGVAWAVLALPQGAARADQGWWGDLDKGQSVRLDDVLAAPEAHRGRTLTFTCVFNRLEKEFNPLRTRFNAERYDNVSVWPDGRALWLGADFERDFPFLYLPRAHAQHNDLLRQARYTRLEVTGRVEVVLDGYPFIEMTAFKVTGHRLGTDVVERMTRAETYWRSNDASAKAIAVDNARAALRDTPDLAPAYASRIRTRLAEWLRSLGREGEARELEGSDPNAAPRVPGAPGEAPAAPPSAPAAELPGTPVEPDAAPSLPGRGADLPGAPVDEPLPPTPPLQPATPREPRRGAPSGPPRMASPPNLGPVPPAPPGPPAPPAPPEVFGPSLPGVPMDEPAPPVRPLPRAAPLPPVDPRVPSPLPPVSGAPVLPPEVVDPPLPPPAKGGTPPPRRPRLAGVK